MLATDEDPTGKQNPGCWYHQGPLGRFLNGYTGQPIILLNDYRASTLESFVTLLSIMEGFPAANYELKGTQTCVRCKVLIITCLYPPIDVIHQGHEYISAFFETMTSADGLKKQKKQREDANQVAQRILESNGAMILFEKIKAKGIAEAIEWRHTEIPIKPVFAEE